MKNYTTPVCKGCYAFNTACGTCEKCKDEKALLESLKGSKNAIIKVYMIEFTLPSGTKMYFASATLNSPTLAMCHDPQQSDKFTDKKTCEDIIADFANHEVGKKVLNDLKPIIIEKDCLLAQ